MRSAAFLKAVFLAVSLVIQLWIAVGTAIFADVVSVQAFAILISHIAFYPLSLGIKLSARQNITLGASALVIALTYLWSLIATEAPIATEMAILLLFLACFYGTTLLVDSSLFEGVQLTSTRVYISILLRLASLLALPLVFRGVIGEWGAVILVYAALTASNAALLRKSQLEVQAPTISGSQLYPMMLGGIRILLVNAEVYGLQLAEGTNRIFLEWLGYAKLSANLLSAFIVPVVGRSLVVAYRRQIMWALLGLLIAFGAGYFLLGLAISLIGVAIVSLVLIDLGARVVRSIPYPLLMIGVSITTFSLTLVFTSEVAVISICKFLVVGCIFVSVLRAPISRAA